MLSPRPPHDRRELASDSEPAAPRPDAPAAAAAFDALVTEHYARLCNFVYRYVRSRATAEDVVQDVFAKLWERGGRLDYRDPVQYLYRAARNRAISYLRQERAVDRLHSRISAHPPESPSAAAESEYDELSAALRDAIAALPERCRLVFTLSRDQGMSYAEIARVLGISVKTVDVQMSRAFKALRRKIAPFLTLLLAVPSYPL